jgi:hypothetical protein
MPWSSAWSVAGDRRKTSVDRSRLNLTAPSNPPGGLEIAQLGSPFRMVGCCFSPVPGWP